jgi:hypothetical protein
MIRYLRALAWLRWHLVVNSLRPTRKRDAVERASRVFQTLGPVLVFLFFIPAILMMGVLGLASGWFLGSSGKFLIPVLVALRFILVVQFILAVLAPLLRATQGAPPNLSRFLLLPVPTRLLYFGEAASSLGDPWVVILSAGVLGLAAGWAAAGSLLPALLVLLAGAALLALLSGVGALSSSFAHLVFRDRRRGELVSLVLLLVISIGGMTPALLSTFQPARREAPASAQGIDGRGAERKDSPPDLAVLAQEWDGRALPPWAAVYPPELYVRCVALASARRASAVLLPLAVLGLWAAAAHVIASRIYRRLLETPESQSSGSRGGSGPRWFELPGLSPAVSAVAVAEIKLVFRTVQGKIGLCLTPVLVLFMAILWWRRPGEMNVPLPFPFGVILAFGGIVFCLLTLEPATLNQFAMDRAGLTLEFLAPVSDRELILGKMAGTAFLGASRGLLCYLTALVAVPGGSPWLWLAVPVAGAAVFLLLAPAGAILSALFPKASDIGRLGQAGKPHPAASALGMLCLLAGAGPAAAAALVAGGFLKRPALAFLLVTGWALLAALISVLLLRAAERLLARRRENLALVAQGR